MIEVFSVLFPQNMVTSKVSTTQRQRQEQAMKPVVQQQQPHQQQQQPHQPQQQQQQQPHQQQQQQPHQQKALPDTTVQATTEPVNNDTRTISDAVMRCTEKKGDVVSEPKRKDDLKPVVDKGGVEVVEEKGNNEGGEENEVTSEVVRKIQQQLDEIKDAPRSTRRRKSRRLQQQEPDLPGPSLPPPQTRHRTPSHRRSRRHRKREETLTDSQISDSQVLQVLTYTHSSFVFIHVDNLLPR